MIRRARVLMTVAAALAALTVPQMSLFAQGNSALKGLAGRKVRLTVAVQNGDGRSGQVLIQGTASDVQGDSINVLQGGGQFSRVSLSSIESIDVSAGRDRWGGAVKGSLIGGAFFLMMSLIYEVECDGNGNGIDCRTDGSSPSRQQYMNESMLSGATLGATIGAIIGVERWESVMATQRVTIAPARGGGFRVGLSLF